MVKRGGRGRRRSARVARCGSAHPVWAFRSSSRYSTTERPCAVATSRDGCVLHTNIDHYQP